MNETMILGIFALAMLTVVLYLAVRDREVSRKLALMERGIDSLNGEIFRLKKELEKSRKELHERIVRFELEQCENGADAAMARVGGELARLKERIDTLSERLDGSLRKEEQRLEAIEQRLKEVTFVSEHTAPDEQRILQLHAQGLDSEAIAKQLRMGKGEVELVLKFAKIHG